MSGGASGRRLLENDFKKMLSQQLRRLERHCVAFDAGGEDAVLDAAVCLRVLFHDTSQSTSLVSRLRVKESLKLINTAAYPFGLCNQELSPQPGASYVRYLPRMNKQEGPAIPCEKWWSEDDVMDDGQHAFTRRDLVLHTAHKVGGAHTDDYVPPEYVFLDEYHSLGFGIQHLDNAGEPLGPLVQPSNSIVYTSVRQIAFEVLASDLKKQTEAAKPRL